METVRDLIANNEYWLSLERDTEKELSFSQLFGNDNPIEIEVGSGKTKFLVARAEQFPERNFLAIELHGKWMKYGFKTASRKELTNIKFLRADAGAILANAIAPRSVSILHVYFPDPWPKRRHQKRRLLSKEFMDQVHKKLIPGGLFEIATDDKPYYEAILNEIDAGESRWVERTMRIDERIIESATQTNYEMKWEREGRELYFIELKRGD